MIINTFTKRKKHEKGQLIFSARAKCMDISIV